MAEQVKQILSELEDTALLLQKAQTNLKKCPKQRLTRGYIEARSKTIEEYWNKFTIAHHNLVKCVPKEQKGDISYFVNEDYFVFEDLYICIQGDLRDLLLTLTHPQSSESKQTARSPANIDEQVKLPRIVLPTFSGDYDDWPAFQDLYTSLVHEKSSLSSVQKLHYLKSSVTGEAAGLLKHIQITESNYSQAWSLLKSRYGNKRLIVNSLLKRLFTQKKIPTQTANHIKMLLDTTSECINSLANLNVSTDSWDPLIIFLVSQKLDPESHRDWEEYAYKDDLEELPTWRDLVKFLETKYRTMELITQPSRERVTKGKECAVHTSTEPVTTKQRCCLICKENHTICHCKEFTKMQPTERCEYIKLNNLCFNCLAPGHSAKRCRLHMSCRICHKRHHTLVHETSPKYVPNQPDNYKAQQSETQDANQEREPRVTMSSHFTASTSTALLATALVPVRNESGQVTVLRALVDHGSQATFISERAAQILRNKRTLINGTITGVGSTKTVVKHACTIELLSRHEDSFKLKVKAYVMPTQLTTRLPTRTITINTWPHLQDLVLADPSFHKSGQIDILLGVEVCAHIMKSSIIKGPPGTPCAQDTSLGWILFGNIQEGKRNQEFTVMHINLDVDNMLQTFWEIETDAKRKLTHEEEACEKIYKETHRRNNDGRYIVKLPLRNKPPVILQGHTRDIAMKRLIYLERRFERNHELRNEYRRVMEEYLEQRHMEEVPNNEIDLPAVYLPHHAVVKNTSETTKVRVVYDASASGTNKISLNDELMVGPPLQEDMRSLVMRWRLKRVGFVADIEKMYRQILVTKEDADLQRILWRRRETDPIKDYRLLRVTFGTASAPYLAVKTMQQVAEDEGKLHPVAAQTIKEDFFMDDLLSGQDSPEEAVEIAKDVTSILKKGGFNLQKWSSNSKEFMQHFPPCERSSLVRLDITVNGTIRTLGLSWDVGRDVLLYNLNLPAAPEKLTKRTILSEIQTLFDPLGWLSPALLPAKLLIQKLWLEGIGWDDPVKPEIKEEWLIVRQSLQHTKDIHLERWLHTTKCNMKDISIHGYCDASIRAYGAVAYLRVCTEHGTYTTAIIAAKSRVAPVKPVTLPRLELCGAVLLSQLLKQINDATRIPVSQTYAWTDSTIVLAWLQGDPARWQTFVRNRVITILENIGNKWGHVQSLDNPADVASRGMLLPDLKDYDIWWRGPAWLREREIKNNEPLDFSTKLESRKTMMVNLRLHENLTEEGKPIIEFENYNSLSELLKTISYAKRFLRFTKSSNLITNTMITTDELEDALQTCIKIEQTETFHKEIQDLITLNKVKTKSPLRALNPYLDSKNIIRVGGRIKKSDVKHDQAHPIILTNKGSLTLLIIAEAHKRTLHGGLQLMMSYLRSRYWILKAKNTVKAYIHKCFVCAKINAKNRIQLMGDLPKVRVTPARPFLNSGVDFAGPYDTLMSKGRGAKTNKSYIAIFICMATKAVHLELVGDLTSEAFIGAFRRFVARRGRCNHLYSDQGRNFVGANKALVEAFKEAQFEFDQHVPDLLASDGTKWHFIPAYSPNFGGLWEAGVKSMKYHLRRILDAHLTFEEMTTLLCQVEACLKSRLLCPVDDSDITNMNVLTPGHFLIGEAPVTIPSPDLKEVRLSNLSRWQFTQRLLSNFWQRWQQEYLVRLQQRPKWQRKQDEFDVGQIVVIKTEGLPPGKWHLGRIVDKHPGSDGITRVYSVKSGANVVKRSITKLCLMPIDTNKE